MRPGKLVRCTFAALAVAMISACSSDAGEPTTAPTRPSSAPTGVSPSASAEAIKLPGAAAGELARSVVVAGDVTSTAGSRPLAGAEYVVRGECQSGAGTANYGYEVTVDGSVTTAGTVTCDGSVTVNSVGPLIAGSDVTIQLVPPGGAGSGPAYVVVVPAGLVP